MEQLSLLTLLILVLTNLSFVSTVVPPFSHHPEVYLSHDVRKADFDDTDHDNGDNNKGNGYHQLTRIILSLNTARFLIIGIGIVQNNDNNNSVNKDSPPIRITSTDTRRAHIDMVYCAFSIASSLLGMGYKQNLLLLITSSFLELNTTCIVICRLIKLADRHRCCRSYLKTSVLCFVTFLCSRVLLPIMFLCHALAQESPFVMDKFPLVWFFVSGVFYLVFHTVFMFYSVRRIMKAYALLAEGASHTCSSTHEPFSVCNNPERLMNDIYNDYEDVPDFDAERDVSLDSEELKFKCKPSTKLRDLNYGFLAPYDNRNLCGLVTGVEEEKINFLQKKNVSKNEFVYKFLIKGEKVNNSPSSCQQCNGEFQFCKNVDERTVNKPGDTISESSAG